MSTPKGEELAAENAELRARLEEAEETLRAIRSGEVDALVMGEEVYTLKSAETPYRLLMESMNEGAATMMRDGTVLYCNRRFAEMAGLPAERIVGSSLGDRVVPAQQEVLRALVGGALHAGARVELTFSAPDGPGLPVLLSLRPIHKDSDSIAVVATDLTERKRAEEALRQAHDTLEQRVRERTEDLRRVSGRDAFLVALADALRPLADVKEIKTAAARLLGQHLRASRVAYAEVTPEGDVIVESGYADGVTDIPGRYRLDDYGPALLPEIRAGHNIVVADVTNAPGYTEGEKARYRAVQVAANLGVPLLKKGRPVALLAVHQAVPRQWMEEEILLVQETVERTWAMVERVRAEQALQASNQELERFNRAMVGRELRMIELKKEIDDLCARFGQPPRYGHDDGKQD